MPIKDKQARLEYQREWVAERRKRFFADKSCVECGSTDRLELDHIDRTTKISNRIWSWREDRRLAEISKCQILCHDCHKEKSSLESQQQLSYAYRLVCDAGHPLDLVGLYQKRHDGVGGACRYCQHIKTATRRGGKIKSLDRWIAFQKRA